VEAASILEGLAVAFPVAFVTSGLTYFFTNRRFRRERTWDKKVEIYASVLKALYDQGVFFDETLDAMVENRDLSKAREQKLSEQSMQGQDTLVYLINTGQLFLSRSATDRLSVFLSEWAAAGNTTHWAEMVMNRSEATRRCLAELTAIAKGDLGVGPDRLSPMSRVDTIRSQNSASVPISPPPIQIALLPFSTVRQSTVLPLFVGPVIDKTA